jgi:hypothetical protein
VQVSPSLQSAQALQVTLPLAAKVPLGQTVHTEAAALEKVPAAQGAQAVVPAALAKLPAGQSPHSLAPGASLNCPGAHGAHAPVTEEKKLPA